MVPEWASFFTAARYELFMKLVRETLTKESMPALIDEESGTWRDEQRVYGLLNLAQMCNQTALDDWASMVDRQIRTMRGVGSHGTDVSDGALLEMLRVRLYPPELTVGTAMVKVEITEGLFACLAVDYPDRVETLDRERARTLGRSSDELFDLAMANVKRTANPTIELHRLQNGASVTSIAGDDFFTSSLALVLPEYLPPEPQHGYLLVVPNRHEVLALRLDHAQSLNGFGFLVYGGRDLFQKGPGSISPYVFWVKNGRWARVEFEETDQGIGLAGPDALLEALFP